MADHPKNSGKAPSFQFYWRDWLTESRLRGVPKFVKGVWIDLICLSCDMPKRGVFLNENGAISEQKLIQMLDGKSSENKRGFAYLKDNHIIKRDTNGVFYVKRIKEDTELSIKRREAGLKGGNPNLLNQKVNQKLKYMDNPCLKKKKKKKMKRNSISSSFVLSSSLDDMPETVTLDDGRVLHKPPPITQECRDAMAKGPEALQEYLKTLKEQPNEKAG